MTAVLRLLQSLFSIATLFLQWMKERRDRAEAKQAVEADIIVQNEARTREAAEIVAERRDPDDAARRLRNGDF